MACGIANRQAAMLLGLVLGASGCGTPEESAPTRDSDPASATPAAAADPDPRQAWLLSESRPVNRACNAPGYRPGQPETYPGLHSHLYPVVQERLQDLVAQVQALAPKVTDEETYDLEADLALRREINVLNQLVFLAGQDLAPRSLLSLCDIPNYDTDQCALMQRMVGGSVVLQDFEREGDSLRYAAQLAADGTRSWVQIANSDLDGIVLQRETGQQATYSGEWSRAQDGTETFAAQGPDGRFSYTEQPDCSGTAQAVREDAGGHPWELAWRWTSVQQPAAFAVQYQECKVNGLNERECISGSL